MHQIVAHRVVIVTFAGTEIPILSATDLVIFKSIFARPKIWVDSAEMLAPGAPRTVDLDVASRWLTKRSHHEAIRRAFAELGRAASLSWSVRVRAVVDGHNLDGMRHIFDAVNDAVIASAGREVLGKVEL